MGIAKNVEMRVAEIWRWVALLVFNLQCQMASLRHPISNSPLTCRILMQIEGGKSIKKKRGDKDLDRQKRNNKRKIIDRSY